MSGVEAVAWTSQTEMEAVRITGDGIMCRASHPKWQVALYSQQSIDTLRAQLEAAEQVIAEAAATCGQALARAEAAEGECARLLTALGTVADWDLPETGETWPSGGPVSFEAQYGSNGARDYMRAVARKAIDLARTKEQQA